MARVPASIPHPSLLQRMRQRLRPAQPDFADHGTAFGLELMLAQPANPAMETTPRRPLRWWRAWGPQARP